MRKVIKRWPRKSPINSVLFCQQVHKAQNLWPFFGVQGEGRWWPRFIYSLWGRLIFPSAYWFTVRADGHERRRRRVITNLMLFFFPRLVLFVALAAEIRRLIWYRWQSTAKSWENTLKMKIFEKQNFQIWYECFKAKRIVVLFITISLQVGKQDESFVQVCWFQRLSLYVRIRLRFFFERNGSSSSKWKSIKKQVMKFINAL